MWLSTRVWVFACCMQIFPGYKWTEACKASCMGQGCISGMMHKNQSLASNCQSHCMTDLCFAVDFHEKFRCYSTYTKWNNDEKCEGDSCQSMCTGTRCTATCSGNNCKSKCIGVSCTSSCHGNDCVKIVKLWV